MMGLKQRDEGFIEISSSSSPEPAPIPTRVRAKPNAAPTVIELSDSDDERAASRVRPKPAPNASAGPSSRRRPPRLGSSSSVENIPKKPGARSVPLFLPSDEENDPPTARAPRKPAPAPFPFQPEFDPEPDRPPTPPPLANDPAPVVDLVHESEIDTDPHSTVTARVLEIIPDVEPDYLLATVTKHILDHPDQNTATVTELILHALFEDNKYPKVDHTAKGKRKQLEQDEANEGTLTKKSKIDYADKDRPFKGGKNYTDIALEHLQTAFPFIPKHYLRQTLTTHNGLYAPAHLFLVEQEKSHEPGVRLPYNKRSTPYRPKGKGVAAQDEELEEERKWLLEHLQGGGNPTPSEAAADEDEDDGACDDGIECGCCFSTYRFDKMIQCPETHLFCMTCMRSYASTLLGTHDPNIKCMDQSGCKALIPPSELKRFLPEKLMTLYERVKQRKEIEAASLEGLEECPFCEWGCVIENPDEKLLRCGNVEACGAVSCRQCKKLDHLPKSCKEMEEDKHLDGRHAVEEAMTQALMRNCPKCQKPFIKESGCNKMTCPHCMTMSCYICRQVIRGYDHFNPEPHRAGSSNNPNAGKCLLWDSVEQRHVDEVKAAAERAQAEYKRANPDVDDSAIKVDLPVAPPAAGTSPALARAQEALRNAQAVLARAQADLARAQADERAHHATMDELHAELQYLEELRHVPGMRGGYELERSVGEKRAGYSRANAGWYQARVGVQQAEVRVRQLDGLVRNAQAQVDALGALRGVGAGAGVGVGGYNAFGFVHGMPVGMGMPMGMGVGVGMGGLNVNVNLYGGPPALQHPLPPPPPVMRPVVPVVRPRAQRRTARR